MVSTVTRMAHLIATRARAYVYSGDWVADCPRDDCGQVEHLYLRSNPRNPTSPRIVQRPDWTCGNCKMSAPIEWPATMADIMQVLMLRPVPQTRNWYPSGHETAVRFRTPNGQTVDELRAENAEHGVPVDGGWSKSLGQRQ